MCDSMYVLAGWHALHADADDDDGVHFIGFRINMYT